MKKRVGVTVAMASSVLLLALGTSCGAPPVAPLEASSVTAGSSLPPSGSGSLLPSTGNTGASGELFGGGSSTPVGQLYLLQSNNYTDIFYSAQNATITNPDGTWTADGTTLYLFASSSQIPCTGSAIAVYQCSPYPNAYSHDSGTSCGSGVTIGTLGYVCPIPAGGQCPAGMGLLYSGTYAGTTFASPFAGGLAFSTTILTQNQAEVSQNGPVPFTSVTTFGCSPTP